MSARDQAVAALFRQLALAADGAVLGVALAYVAVRTFIRFASTSSAARLIRDAPSVAVPDLRSLLSSSGSDGDGGVDGAAAKLVVVRGAVEAKSAVDGSWKKSLWPDVLGSKESSAKAVVIQRTQSCIYNEWRGLFGWTPDLRGVLARSFKEQESSSTRMVPFILTDSNSEQPLLEYVVVNLDGSRHPMPLTTVYHHMQPISASPYTVLQALFGHDYPIGLLDEEKILPLGKEVTAVGFCYTKNGILEIKSSRDLPYFLSELTQDQIVIELSYKTKILLWSGLIFGSLAVCILGFSVVR
ncbi:E3 ubiquitin-protein ligase SPL2-like protein [Drosera capensis]